MFIPNPGWLRPLAALVLVVLGIILRFTLSSRIGGFGLRRFRTHPDEDITDRVRHRLGEMLLVWAGWLVIQMGVGLRESWASSIWAPLLIVIAATSSYSARLLVRRYAGDREGRDGEPPVPSWGGWLLIAAREALPLAAILTSILVVRANDAGIPDRVPVGWNLAAFRATDWMPREAALNILRHRTMVVYGVLFGLEGAYLIVTWALGRRRDIARRMLSRRHWQYFVFKLGWVLLLAGMNVGLVFHAVTGLSPVLFVLPGILTLVALALAVVLDLLRQRWRAPAL